MLFLKIPRLFPLVIVLLLLCCSLLHARIFILPGVYYNGDQGWVLSGMVIAETENKTRLDAAAAFYGVGERQFKLTYFRPRSNWELTTSLKLELTDQDAFSQVYPTLQEELGFCRRNSQELLLRCDFPHLSGFFYGVEGGYRRFNYRVERTLLLPEFDAPQISEQYDDGYEATGSLRLGAECRDNRFHSQQGYFLLGQVDLGGVGSPGTKQTLIRAQMDARRYFQLFWDKTILAVNLRGGMIHEQVPYFARFKLGGSQSLRGFPLDRYNGSAFYLLRVELRQILRRELLTPLHTLRFISSKLPNPRITLGLVAFTDCGDCWRDDYGWWGIRQGVGGGVRIIFPPSIVAAMDLAKPLDSSGYEIYLELRQSF